MGLQCRLNKLEQQAARSGRGRPCPGCGYFPGCQPDLHILPSRVISNISELNEPEDTSKDLCGVCGRRVVFRIPSPRLARLGTST